MVTTIKDNKYLEALVRDAHEQAHEVSEGKNLTNQKRTSNKVIHEKKFQILTLLAIQNCGKNILMRFIMKEQPQFLH